MTNIEENEDLISQVKRVLFKYCPYTNDRVSLMDGNTPEFDMHFNLGKDSTDVLFVYGNSRAKSGVEDNVSVPYVATLDEIEELIDFIKEDHESMRFDKHDVHKKVTELKFNINWREEMIKGLDCGTISIVLHFRDNPELENKYTYFLNQKYFNSSDLACKWGYTNEVMKTYIDSLDKEGLIKLLSKMSEEELRSMISPNMNKVMEYAKEEPKVKELLYKNN